MAIAANPRVGSANPLLILGVMTAVLLVTRFPDVSALLEVWDANHALSHGYLALPVLAWLTWEARSKLVASADAPLGLTVAGLLLLGVAWAMAYVAAVESVRSMLLPLNLALLVLGMLGTGALRALLFPIAWLYLCLPLPVWDWLPPPLQAITAVVSAHVVGFLGIPVFITGETITVPVGSFEVAGGCSGANFFVVSLGISTLYAHVLQCSWRRAAGLVALALALAMFANWLRVIIIIVVATITNMQTSLVDDHYAFGWWLFAGALAVFFLLATRWFPAAPVGKGGSSAPVEAHLPIPLQRLSVLLLALVIGPVCGYVQAARADTYEAVAPVWRDFGAWSIEPAPEAAWRPRMIGAQAEARVALSGPEGLVVSHVSAYGRQRAGEELIGYRNSLAGQDGWQIVESGPSPVGEPGTVEMITESPTGDRWRVLYWYEVGGKPVRSARAAKLHEALALFTGPVESRLVALAAACGGPCTSRSELGSLGGLAMQYQEMGGFPTADTPAGG